MAKMTLEKLATLRDTYADKVKAYQEANRDAEKTAISKTKAAMRRAGKSYLKGMDEALIVFSESEVNAVTSPTA